MHAIDDPNAVWNVRKRHQINSIKSARLANLDRPEFSSKRRAL